MTFLNHGSFGATPKPVLAAQQGWRDRMEAEPVRFFARDLEPALDAARAALATFVGSNPEDLAWIPNATTGFNTVLRSLRLEPGDELLTTDHAYNAARTALDAVAADAGARVVVASIGFPGATPQSALDAVLSCCGPRTRLALLDHVTSATALVLPLAELVGELAARGVEILVDGAHAPGMLELDLISLGATYYTGNLHKWVCGPKGTGFLWVHPERRERVRPLVISHGANSPRSDRTRFRLEFDWTGTFDPSSYLAVPSAIEFGASLLPGGWSALRARNRALAIEARDRLCAVLEVAPPAPDEMIGSMTSVPLPEVAESAGVQGIDLYSDPVHAALLAQGIQVMVTPWPPRPTGRWRRLVRISAAPYTDMDDVERLATALGRIGTAATTALRAAG